MENKRNMAKKQTSLVEKVTLQTIHDDCLMCVAEGGKQVPFDIKRIYYMVDSEPNLPRGYHTHKELEQVFFCIRGSMKMVLDDGYHREEIVLDDPSVGVMLRPMVWHEMHDIDKETVMLIFASDKYLESDYIREYATFKKIVDERDK